MLPRNWFLMIIAVAAAIALFIFVNGCAATRSVSSRAAELTDEDNFLVVVPLEGLMFEAGKWWTARLPERKDSAVAAILVHGVHPAQVLIGIRSDDGRPLIVLAEEMGRIEKVGERELSKYIGSMFGPVDRVAFDVRSSVRDRNGDRLIEHFILARSPELPGRIIEFFGAWTEDREEQMADETDVMAATLRAMPPAMIESYRRNR